MNRTSTTISAALGSIVLAGAVLSAQPAASQQMGREGYNFPARSPSLAAQFEFQRQMQQRARQGSAGGLGALNQYVTTYSSNSTSIGNMSTVNQNLGDGATGTVDVKGDQSSTGDQGSEASTDTKIDNSVKDSGNLTEVLEPLEPNGN